MYEWTGRNIGEPMIPSAKETIIALAELHLGENYLDHNSCDEWVAKLLIGAKLEPSDYCLGDTSETVAQHINELNTSNMDYSKTAYNSVYVVFMGDGTKSYTIGHEHAGLLSVGPAGEADFYHSSRNNEGALSEKDSYKSVSAFESAYAYSSFYYQGIY